MKKFFALLLVTVLCIGCFAGCSPEYKSERNAAKLINELEHFDGDSKLSGGDLYEVQIDTGSDSEAPMAIYGAEEGEISYIISPDADGESSVKSTIFRVEYAVLYDIDGDGEDELIAAGTAKAGDKSMLTMYEYDTSPYSTAGEPEMQVFCTATCSFLDAGLVRAKDGIHLVRYEEKDGEKTVVDDYGKVSYNGIRFEAEKYNALNVEVEEVPRSVFDVNENAVHKVNGKEFTPDFDFIYHHEKTIFYYFEVSQLEELLGQKIDLSDEIAVDKTIMTIFGKKYVSNATLEKFFDATVDIDMNLDGYNALEFKTGTQK